MAISLVLGLGLSMTIFSPTWRKEPKLSPPPDGFAWQKFPETRLTILRPKGWFVRSTSANGINGSFISKENTETHGRFRTGLTVNYIPEVSRKSKSTASNYATRFAASAIQKREPKTSVLTLGGGDSVLARQVEVPHRGPVKTSIFRVLIEGPPEDLIMHYVLVADDELDCLHVIFFEAPAKEWQSAWKMGQVMLGDFLISLEPPTAVQVSGKAPQAEK